MISSSGNMTKQSSRKIHSCEDNDALADDHSTPEERPPDGDDKSVSPEERPPDGDDKSSTRGFLKSLVTSRKRLWRTERRPPDGDDKSG